MERATPSRIRNRTLLLAGALLVVAGGLGWRLAGGDKGKVEVAVAAPVKMERPAPVASRPVERAVAEPAAALAALPEAPPVVAAPGHEGHGDECAQCLAERKLAVYREDYAKLQFEQALRDRMLPADQGAELLEACRKFSKSVVREWSFGRSMPLLMDDESVERLRSQLLQPLIDRLPPADETP